MGPFCTPDSICLNISFWKGSFCMEEIRFQSHDFQLKYGTPIFWKTYWKCSKFPVIVA